MIIGRFAIVPIFYRLELMNGEIQEIEIPCDLSYISSLCDNKHTAEELCLKLETKRNEWVGPIKRHEIVVIDCIDYDIDKTLLLPDFLYLDYESCISEKDLIISFLKEDLDFIKFRKNVYYYEGIINKGKFESI
jgi:hypothetical protein